VLITKPQAIVTDQCQLAERIMKSMAKSILRAASQLMVLPAVGLFGLQASLMGRIAAFAGWSQLFSLLPGTTGEYLRHAFYRFTAEHCGDDACIGFATLMVHPGIRIGQSSYIGNFCSIGHVSIEHDVLIASHVSIMNGCRQHGTSRLDVPIREQPGEFVPVTIGAGSWIGERATVAADVGKQCIVGAGSLVLNPIPDYAIAVGVPARVVGDRREGTRSETSTCAAQPSDGALATGVC
jgi:acetyltransferase-like isoleucine patch superfamily enzyme